MKQYTLYELIGQLRMGGCEGGMVEKIGHVSGVEFRRETDSFGGMKRLSLSPNVMLERCEKSERGTSKAVFSMYDPYMGSFVWVALETEITDPGELYMLIEEISKDEQHENVVFSYHLYKKNIYRTTCRYSTVNTSVRSGQIGKPQKSKIFRG